MPELPEVETVCRALRPHLVGQRIDNLTATVPALRAPIDLRAMRRFLRGQTIVAVRRRGKHILIETDKTTALLLHLGMSGSCRIVTPDEPLGKHEHLRIDLDCGTQWRFADPRRFGMARAVRLPFPGGDPEELSALGVEPLSRVFSGTYLADAVRNRRIAIKPFLLDQRVVAGIGNIYASEACFRAGIDPRREAGTLAHKETQALSQAIKQVLRKAIAKGGTTIRDYRTVDGTEGKFRILLDVYERENEACRRKGCKGAVQRLTQAGRSTYFCPACQR